MNLKAIYDKLFSTDLATWIGHGVLGLLIGLVLGPAAVLAAFLYRELSDLLEWQLDDDPFKRDFQSKLKDGFFDLWAPLAGAALAEILKATVL